MKKTADNADAGVSRLRSSSLSSLRSDLLSQPLWSCQNYFQNKKATLSRGCDSRSPKATATRCASVRRERARAVSKTEGLAMQVVSLRATATDESDKLESGAHTCSGCATSCASVSEHQRNQRFVLMGLELWKQSNSI